MAYLATIPLKTGEVSPVYIRLNSISSSNHGEPSVALFRAFASEDAFLNGSSYKDEWQVEFLANVKEHIWPQAYKALEGSLPWPDAEDSLVQAQASLTEITDSLQKLEDEKREALTRIKGGDKSATPTTYELDEKIKNATEAVALISKAVRIASSRSSLNALWVKGFEEAISV